MCLHALLANIWIDILMYYLSIQIDARINFLKVSQHVHTYLRALNYMDQCMQFFSVQLCFLYRERKGERKKDMCKYKYNIYLYTCI